MVTVRVPATSANVGSGFDAIGLALAITADVTVSLEPVNGDGYPLAPMIANSARAAYRAAGQPEPEEISVVWEDTEPKSPIPIARGLGASAAARAAGIVAGNALMGGALDDDQLLSLGAELEGHADNMAPALFGGLQITVNEGGVWRRIAAPYAEGLKIALFVPDLEMPTRESRARLPARLRREDAIFNVGRAAMLVAALQQGRWDLLGVSTEDRLHQSARTELFPALPDIIGAALEAGAHAAYLSGGGSTVAALVTKNAKRVASVMHETAVARGYTGRTMITEPSPAGATLL